MVLQPRTRKLAGWLTLVALTLALLAPGISRALAYAQGQSAPWGAICSTAQPGGQPGDRGTAAGSMLDACAYCAGAADLAVPPPSPAAALLLSARGHEVPRLFLQAPHTLYAWRTAPARGPPSAS